jgi:hypothetical protein
MLVTLDRRNTPRQATVTCAHRAQLAYSLKVLSYRVNLIRHGDSLRESRVAADLRTA